MSIIPFLSRLFRKHHVGAEKDSMKPRCEECGLDCYSIFAGSGIKGC
jgi:hypothetical protein